MRPTAPPCSGQSSFRGLGSATMGKAEHNEAANKLHGLDQHAPTSDHPTQAYGVLDACRGTLIYANQVQYQV